MHRRSLVAKDSLREMTSPKDEKSAPAVELKTDTIIVGMGPVGLMAGASALLRRDKVIFITDRDPQADLGLRSQILSVDINAFELLEYLLKTPVALPLQPNNINPVTEEVFSTIYDKYIHHQMIIEYPRINRVTFAISTVEKALLELITALQKDGAEMNFIEVERIDRGLLNRLGERSEMITATERGVTVTPAEIKDIHALRARQDVDIARCQLRLSGVKKINHTPVSPGDIYQLHFSKLLICNGIGRSMEKGMLDVTIDNIRSNNLILKYHATVIFDLSISYKIFDKVKTSESKSGMSIVPLSKFIERGWEHGSRPFNIYFTCGKGPTKAGEKQPDQFYMGFEIPKILFDEHHNPTTRMQAEEKITEYAYLLMRDQFPEKLCQTFKKSREPLAVSSFEIDLQQLNRPCILSEEYFRKTGDVGLVCIFGDGLMSPLYISGTGLQTAMKMLQCYNQAQKELGELKRPKEDDITTIFQKYHGEVQDILLFIGNMQENVVNMRNNNTRSSTTLKAVSSQIQEIYNHFANLLVGFTITLSGTSSSVSRFFNVKTFPLSHDEKMDLKAISTFFKLLLVKNLDTLISYEAPDFFVTHHTSYKNLLDYYKAVVSVADKLNKITEKISLKHPGDAMLGETPERFALRKLCGLLKRYSLQLTEVAMLAQDEIIKLTPKDAKAPKP